MPASPTTIKAFQEKVATYYTKKKRDLPWRNTTDPYSILLSEIMLQQTQVSRVIPYYRNWLQQWPTIRTLANAKRTDVLRAWMGLGYNNRAIRLHKAAKKIVKEYKGNVLNAMKDYKNIPGIGLYTASAVRIFSQNEDIVTVDTNIRRILIHEFGLAKNMTDKEVWTLAKECLPQGKSRDWHNGLMDYGATLLTSRKTGIKPKTQQGTFEGSNRQLRAKIVKLFLKEGTARNIQELQEETGENNFSRMQSIVWKMIQEGLLEKEGKKYVLKKE